MTRLVALFRPATAVVAGTLLFLAQGAAVPVSAAHADYVERSSSTLTVTSSADSGAGTLRDAIANASSGDTIVFNMSAGNVTSPITLTSGDLELTKDVTIQGPGASTLTLTRDSSASTFRIFRISPNVNAAISGVTISNGVADQFPTVDGAGQGGGNILNEGNLVLDSVVVTGGFATHWGDGIYNGAFSFNAATLTILNSTIANNGLPYNAQGGGIFNGTVGSGTTTLHMSGSTITGNGDSQGAGIFSDPFRANVSVDITNSTISGNSSTDGSGGGLYFNSGGGLFSVFATLTNVTITANDLRNSSSGGGINNADPSNLIILNNTIVAGNLGNDISGTMAATSRHNLIGTDSGMGGIFNGVNGNQVGTGGSTINAKLGPLQNNGGSTLTHDLLAGSPAIDAGDNSLASLLSTDQRGEPRELVGAGNFSAIVDIGAVEAYPTVTAIADQSMNEDSVLVVGFSVADISQGIGPVFATSSDQSIVSNGGLVITGGGGGSATLTITPNVHANGVTTVTVTATDGGSLTGTSQFTLTVNPVAHTPSISNAITLGNIPTTNGLVVIQNPLDSPTGVPFLKVTGIANGTLFLGDGVTQVTPGSFISVLNAIAGLKFAPTPNSLATGQFTVQASTSASDAGLGGAPVTAQIFVLAHATATAVVSADPNPSDPTEPISVVFYVVSTDGGPQPTGPVTVSISGGPETCVGDASTLIGQCTLTPSNGGLGQTITATYNGNAINLGTAVQGTSGTISHDVNTCTVNPIVTGTGDDVNDPTSLRYAIAHACFHNGTNTITFNITGASPHVIALGSQLELSQNVNIAGPTDKSVQISGNGNSTNVLLVDASVTANLSNLVIADGFGYFNGSVLVGGALGNNGTTTLDNSTLTNHTGYLGGAVVNNGTLTISRSTLSGNSALNGGALLNNLGTATILASTLSGNSAGHGGAIVNSTTLTISNSTISGNTADDGAGGGTGGGIYVNNFSPLTLTQVTITNNHASFADGGVLTQDGSVTAANSIIAGNTAGIVDPDTQTGFLNLQGNNFIGGDPKLGPLQHNGGSTQTHMPRPGSPVLDAGDNTIPTNAGLTTDQRGTGFGRILDAADADTVQTVDIGAVEADPIVDAIADQTINENGSVRVTFNVGDTTTPFDSIAATSSNTTLLPNTAGHVDLTGTGSTRTLTLTPLTFFNGTSVITVTATKTVQGVPLTSSTSFTLTVNSVNDPPTLNAIPNPPPILEDSALQTINLSGISAGPNETQVLTITVVSSNVALIPNPTVHVPVIVSSPLSAPDSSSLSYTPVANAFGVATITVTVTDDLGATVQRQFTVGVTPVADTPSVTDATTVEDAATTSGLVISRNPVDGAEVTHFKITNIVGGTLASGSTPIPSGTFITFAAAQGTLAFTPTTGFNGTAHFDIQASINATDAGLGGGVITAHVTVASVPDLPNITTASTLEDTQTTNGLVIARNSLDGSDVAFFVITQVLHGSLFQHDGVTPIPAGGVITDVQAAAGLRFTPDPNFFGTAQISVRGALDSSGGGNGKVQASQIAVSPVADAPSITDASTAANAQTTSGLVITRNPVDGSEVFGVKIISVVSGTLFQANGTTPVPAGSFIDFASAGAGLKFTPTPNSLATGSVTIQATLSASDAGLGGPQVTAHITVGTLSTTTTVTTSTSPSAPGQSITFTATVSPAAAASSGTIQFSEGATSLGSGTLANGVATFATSSLPPGVHHVSATFAAAGVYAGSSGTVDQIVTGGRTLSTGADAGGLPQVKRFAALDGGTPTSGPTAFLAGDANFGGGVRVAEADINGDGVPDIIIGAGPGSEPRVTVYDGASGGIQTSFLAYDASFTGGVYVAAGDVDGDGRADIVTGAGSGTSNVRVFSGASGAMIASFNAFTPAFTGGVRVAVGDVDGDGHADIITGAGPGASSVRVFSGGSFTEIAAIEPYAGFPGGVFVAAGDVNGDGYADIITGADAGGGPHVRVFDGRTQAVLASFFAGDPGFTGGVRVAAGDVNGDGRADIITSFGPGGGALVRVFDGATLSVLTAFPAYTGGFNGGVFVATAAPLNLMVLDVPGNSAIVGPNFLVAGWAIESDGAPGTAGVDAVHVWATPTSGASATFLGAATLGDPRPDVSAAIGQQYPNPGFHLAASGLAPGTYDISAYAHNNLSGRFDALRTARIFVKAPGSDVRVQVSTPSPNTTVAGSFRIAGSALDVSGTPIDAVHVWANGPAGLAFLGVATLGDARPDVATTFGAGFANAGFHLDVTGLADGQYTLLVFAHSAAAAAFAPAVTLGVTVATPQPVVQASLDLPARGTNTHSFLLAGWALTQNVTPAPGITTIHAWALPVGSGTPVFLGVPALGGPRPDVASIFGSAYGTAGFNLAVPSLPSGTWDITVFIWPSGASGFTTTRVVRITIP